MSNLKGTTLRSLREDQTHTDAIVVSSTKRDDPLKREAQAERGKSQNITLSNEVLFKTGSSVLSDAGKERLNNLVKKLQGKDIIELRVDGYTDRVGNDQDNMKLSKDRANAVAEYLKQELGKKLRKDINTQGHGENDFKGTPDNVPNQSFRRADIGVRCNPPLTTDDITDIIKPPTPPPSIDGIDAGTREISQGIARQIAKVKFSNWQEVYSGTLNTKTGMIEAKYISPDKSQSAFINMSPATVNARQGEAYIWTGRIVNGSMKEMKNELVSFDSHSGFSLVQ